MILCVYDFFFFGQWNVSGYDTGRGVKRISACALAPLRLPLEGDQPTLGEGDRHIEQRPVSPRSADSKLSPTSKSDAAKPGRAIWPATPDMGGISICCCVLLRSWGWLSCGITVARGGKLMPQMTVARQARQRGVTRVLRSPWGFCQ